MIRKTLALLALSLLLTACTRQVGGSLSPDADPKALPPIAGEYALNGHDAGGAEYGGRLTITANPDGSFELQWLIFESIQQGAGRISGNRLEVVWSTVEGFPNPMSGTAVYTITTAGELYGTKVIDGLPGQATETAYPNSPENMSR